MPCANPPAAWSGVLLGSEAQAQFPGLATVCRGLKRSEGPYLYGLDPSECYVLRWDWDGSPPAPPRRVPLLLARVVAAHVKAHRTNRDFALSMCSLLRTAQRAPAPHRLCCPRRLRVLPRCWWSG